MHVSFIAMRTFRLYCCHYSRFLFICQDGKIFSLPKKGAANNFIPNCMIFRQTLIEDKMKYYGKYGAKRSRKRKILGDQKTLRKSRLYEKTNRGKIRTLEANSTPLVKNKITRDLLRRYHMWFRPKSKSFSLFLNLYTIPCIIMKKRSVKPCL